MRRTKTEQIKDIRSAIINNPGITISGIVGLARVDYYQTHDILEAMQETHLITIKLRNKIYWNNTEEEPQP